MDHRATKAADWRKKRRNRVNGTPPQWAVVRGMLHMRLKEAAAKLNVPIGHLRRLCRQNGYGQWPGKQIRYFNRIVGRDLEKMQVDASATQIAETKKKEEEEDKTKEKEEDKTRIPPAPAVNDPSTKKNVKLAAADVQDGSPGAGLAAPSQLAKNAETQKEDDDKMTGEDDDKMTGIHAPVVNHPPRKELTTLNLIDKVGSSSSGERS